jgi:hypothetical protein
VKLTGQPDEFRCEKIRPRFSDHGPFPFDVTLRNQYRYISRNVKGLYGALGGAAAGRPAGAHVTLLPILLPILGKEA